MLTHITTSVLIANLHSPLLGKVLEALRQQTILPSEVLVVGQDRYGFAKDDGWVRFFPTPEPKPPAIALNIAFCYAQGELLCFLDADCLPKPDWLEQLINLYLAGYDVIGGSTDFMPNSYWQLCDNIACQGDFLVSAPVGARVHLQSGNMAIARRVIHSVGFFDESFRRAAGEDTEYSLRLRSNGYQLYFDTRPCIEHHTNRTNALAVWRHLALFGRSWPMIAWQYRTQLPGIFSIWLWLFCKMPLLALPFIPLLAFRDIIGFYASQSALYRQYWYTLPGVIWARMGWYQGVLEGAVNLPLE